MKKFIFIFFLFIFFSTSSFGEKYKWECVGDKGSYSNLKYINFEIDFRKKKLSSDWEFLDQKKNEIFPGWEIVLIDKEKVQVKDGWFFYYGTDQRAEWRGEVFYHKCNRIN